MDRQVKIEKEKFDAALISILTQQARSDLAVAALEGFGLIEVGEPLVMDILSEVLDLLGVPEDTSDRDRTGFCREWLVQHWCDRLDAKRYPAWVRRQMKLYWAQEKREGK